MRALGLIIVSSGLIVGAWWLSTDRSAAALIYEAARDSIVPATEEMASANIFFLGDVMLARDVEKRLSVEIPSYAFLDLGFLREATAVVGNFEAAVPEKHEPTPSMVMKFSVPAFLLEVLSEGGVTHLSLANNHALDFGEEGYRHTVNELESRGSQVFGHPVRVDRHSVSYIEAGEKTVAIVGINATYGELRDTWRDVFAQASDTSDLQVVFVHWGTEYELSHDQTQEKLARLFVDMGADLVIGHHPHVVQDVERYRDKLIFYSLGNFIFDQYWNDDVSEGLLLELILENNGTYINLLPIESKTTRVRPRLILGNEKREFLDELADRSSENIAEDIRRGRISLQF